MVGLVLYVILWLCLYFFEIVELCYGVGWGLVVVFGDELCVEDGFGWWVVWEVIEVVCFEVE